MFDLAPLLIFATPVALAAIGEAVSQRSGVINVGIEGSMLGGAYFGMLTSSITGNAYFGLLAGLGYGIAAALILSLFSVIRQADQVVVGTALNLLALGLTGTMFRARFGSGGQLLSVPQVPRIVFGIDLVVVTMVVAAAGAYWLLQRTHWGLALRSAGEYPSATEAAGQSVRRIRMAAVLIGGALAGLGGAYLSLGIAGSFAENMTAGRGFVALAMVTFGRWNPILAVGASLLIGYAESLQFTFQTRGTGLPYQLFIAMPYALALLVLMVFGRGTRAPAALAQPFERSA
ncbi:MAG: hypothetical protein HONBIEJF_01921 [Fimbriimonadaceae bacterium]|nr:hypothetical protein [Fimbriimonadaceae bacterium]